MHVESSEKFRFSPHSQTPHGRCSFHDGVAGKLLHLDVIKLPEVTEPLDELRGDAARELRRKQKKKVSELMNHAGDRLLTGISYIVYTRCERKYTKCLFYCVYLKI